jgi:5-methylthioadenosine/S-adenosylhomocysteine deaminase
MTDNAVFIRDGAILIEGRQLVYVGPADNLPPFSNGEPKQVIQANGLLALPGFINAHLHMALNITKGFVEDVDFKDILFEVLYPAEASLNEEELYYSALVGGLEALKQGSTTLIDQYHHGQINTRVINDLGARAELSLMAQDFDLKKPPVRGSSSGWIEKFDPDYGLKELEENLILARQAQKKHDSRIHWRLGINSPDTVSEVTLREASHIAHSEGLGIHIHLAQSKIEQDFSKMRWAKTSVEFLDEIGLLDVNAIVAHCTVLTDHDIELLTGSKAIIAHCPISNAKGGPVIAPIPTLIEKGAKIALGTDTTPSDMLEVIRWVAVLHKTTTRLTTTLPAMQALRLATIDGARAIGRGEELGSLEPGKLADVILVDINQPHIQPFQAPASTLVYNAHGTDIRWVIVDGQIVVRESEHCWIDERKVLEKYVHIYEKVWKRAGFDSSLG